MSNQWMMELDSLHNILNLKLEFFLKNISRIGLTPSSN